MRYSTLAYYIINYTNLYRYTINLKFLRFKIKNLKTSRSLYIEYEQVLY